jgi:SAM-dependent methyltransferase
MAAEFDGMAASWEGDRGGYRPPVLADALARGGPFRPGRAVELASGTGLLTPLIAAVWRQVVAVDLSWGMLGRPARGSGFGEQTLT